MLGDGVEPLEVKNQERRAPAQVRPELGHHQFFNVFAHVVAQSSFAYAWIRMPGLMVAEIVTVRIYVPLAAAGFTVRR